MAGIFHYPWRLSFFLQGRACGGLPEPGACSGRPAAVSVSPEIGAFVWDGGGSGGGGDGGGEGLREIPGPSLEEGAGRRWHDVPGFERAYYAESAHQFGAEGEEAARDFHFALTDALIWMCAALYGQRKKGYDALADRPLAEVCGAFVEYLGTVRDFAPESLIIEIAREAVPLLGEIVRRPRMALRRRHENIPLDRMQEMDTEVLLDYARRPGRTAAMKAGPRQRLLGVVRAETADTYENRAVLDFIRRAGRSARGYRQGMCGRCPKAAGCAREPAFGACESERVKLAARFERLCAVWEGAADLSEVARLRKPCVRPNYALQQNARYVFVWRYYQRLLRQEDIEADVWRWKRRSFADAARMFMMALWELRLVPKSVLRTSGKPFMVREVNDRGAWLVPDPFEDALVFSGGGGPPVTLYLLNTKEAAALLRAEDGLWRLNADFFWIAVPAGGGGGNGGGDARPRVCPVWCICRDRMWEGEGLRKYAGAALEEVRTLCGEFGREHRGLDCSRGWILAESDATGPVAGGGEGDGFRFWGLGLFRPEEGGFERKTAGLAAFLERMVE